MQKFLFSLLGFAFLTIKIFAQGHITGKVTNENDGSPIAGASVIIKGGASVVSSAEGTFTIPVKKNEETLTVTSIGFYETSVRAKAGTVAPIVLKVDVRTLSEVIVTGTGVPTSKRIL